MLCGTIEPFFFYSKLCWNVPLTLFYKMFVFCVNCKSKMAATILEKEIWLNPNCTWIKNIFLKNFKLAWTQTVDEYPDKQCRPMRSPVLKGHLFLSAIENLIRTEPLLKGHLSYKATFSLFQRWSLNTGLTIYIIFYHVRYIQGFLVKLSFQS